MKKIRVEDAVGTVLAHDMTRIIPGEFKGVGFKKGHVVKPEDIAELKKIGKQHLFVLDLGKDLIHEDEAALRIASAVTNDSLEWSEPREGKSNITAKHDGLLKVNVAALLEINRLEHIALATLKNNFPCTKNQIIAGTRIIPLTIEKDKIIQMEKVAAKLGPILRILPFRKLKVGAVVTGSEIYNGLITDEFESRMGKRLTKFKCELTKKLIVADDVEAISKAIIELKDLGCELIIITGGLSVDPDDVTRQGVKKTGADIAFYGSPVLPGAMFLYAKLGNTPIMGLPACVYYSKQTIFDLLFPQVLAGEEILEDDIIAMGHGGLCMNCEVCHFPSCTFGR
jgi:molybdenum cofactor synthesis domain-containing protein